MEILDVNVIRQEAFVNKHSELIELARQMGKIGLSLETPSSKFGNVSGTSVPSNVGELLLWGKFYSGNALYQAFDDAFQEYSILYGP